MFELVNKNTDVATACIPFSSLSVQEEHKLDHVLIWNRTCSVPKAIKFVFSLSHHF